MACYLNDNVFTQTFLPREYQVEPYTHTFTPREYQVELLDAVKKENTVVCLSTSSAKAFIVVKLIQEFSWQMRSTDGKRVLFLLDQQNVPVMTSHIKLLTDLNVVSVNEEHTNSENSNICLDLKHVLVCSAEICANLLSLEVFDLNRFNLLIVDDCLYGKKQSVIKEIMKKYDSLKGDKPRVLGLAAGLLGLELQPERIESEFQRLEKLLKSHVDTSSEVVTLLRLTCRPREKIVVCSNKIPTSLETLIHQQLVHLREFLLDHRYSLLVNLTIYIP